MSYLFPATIGLLLLGAPLAGTGVAYLSLVAISGVIGGLRGSVNALKEHDNCHLQQIEIERKAFMNGSFNQPPAPALNKPEPLTLTR